MSEILLEQEIQAFKDDQKRIEEIKKKLADLSKNGQKINPFQKIQELTEVMNKQDQNQLNTNVADEENPDG